MKLNMRTKSLEIIFYSLLVIIALMVILTPYLIKEGISLLSEEMIEMILIVVLFVVGILVFYFYKLELTKVSQQVKEKSKNLDEAFKYIGRLNVYISEINSIFNSQKKYPGNKKDFKYIIEYLVDKILSIINVAWVIIRIIDNVDDKVLYEYAKGRRGAVLLKAEISNKSLLSEQKMDGYSYLFTEKSDIIAQVFCVMPETKITEEQRILTKAILNQIQMAFLIFTSVQYSHE